MVHVEVVVHVVVAVFARELHGGVVRTAVRVREESARTELAEEGYHARRAAALDVRHEVREGGVVGSVGGDVLRGGGRVGAERGIGGAALGEPLRPGVADDRVLACGEFLARPAHRELSLVYEGDERHRGLVEVAAARVWVHVQEELFGELLPVLERGVPERHEALVEARFGDEAGAAVGKADVLPRDGTRHEEVGRHVEPLADCDGEEVVETVDHLRNEFKTAL